MAWLLAAPRSIHVTLEFGGLVLLCDDRFREVTGAACGGPAEGNVTPDAGGGLWGPLLDRFEAAPERFVSVYGRARPWVNRERRRPRRRRSQSPRPGRWRAVRVEP